MSTSLLQRRSVKSALVILVIYSLGVAGLMSEKKMFFAELSMLPLLIVNILLVLNNRQRFEKVKYYKAVSILVGLGFVIEVIGVHTGFIFGEYSYTRYLGIRLFGVPLIIGANWMGLVIATSALLDKLSSNKLIVSLLGAVLITAIDIPLEIVAMKLSFWKWPGDQVPIQNYAAWFIVAFGMMWFYSKQPMKKSNRLAPYYLLLLVGFLVGVIFLVP